MTKKILVIAPHADDDILAFGGYLIDEIAKGAEVHMRIGTIGGVHKLQNFDVRIKEFESVMEGLGIPPERYSYYYKGYDAEMEKITIREIATKIDADLDSIRPDEVFCCYPSTHQDHIRMHQAFMVSMRLRDGYMPPLVAFGEYPFILTSMDIPNGGRWYHPLSQETLSKKVELFLRYKTQVKPSPSALGERGVIQLASTRGFESGVEYAELFYIQKIVR